MKNLSKYFLLTFSVIITFSFFISCKEESAAPEATESDVSYESTFLYSPIDVEKIEWLEPLGCMNPPEHTIPVGHVYFYFNFSTTAHQYDSSYNLPVYAPASGIINWLLMTGGPDNDTKIMVKVNSSFTYYLDHIILTPGLKVGSAITAGQIIGKTGFAYAIDLGVVNKNITRDGFYNQARYGQEFLNSDSPYKYYQEPLKSKLYSLVKRISNDKDGKIDYDVKGRLIGNWYHESVKIEESDSPSAWVKELAFVPDSYNPAQLVISSGGYSGISGKFKPRVSDPDPANVNVNSGKVIYNLNGFFDAEYYGVLLVQVLDDVKIKIEFFPGKQGNNLDFDSKALIYTR
jgi:hypothetical protein